MGCIVYTDYMYQAFVPRRQFLPLPSFRKVFFFFPTSLPPCVSFSFFIFGLLVLSYPPVSLPDLGSHFAFLFSSVFVYIPMLCHWSSWLAVCFIKSVTCGQPYKKIMRESERTKKEDVKILSFPMSEAWSAVSALHSQRIEWEMLLSQLACGHPHKMAS